MKKVIKYISKGQVSKEDTYPFGLNGCELLMKVLNYNTWFLETS